jgi:PAS domain-containing protein
MLTAIIEQAILLLALGWLLTLNIRRGQHYPRLLILTSGLWFGVIAIVCMLMPFTVTPGVLLDARNTVLFVAGLFGGPFSGGMTLAMAGGFRLWLGGEGATPGLFNLALALALGLGMRHALRRGWARLELWHLLPVVVLLHLTTVALISWLLSPAERALLQPLIGPFLLVMVPLTLMLVFILKDAEQRRREQLALRANESRLRAITGALPDLLFVMNEEGRCLEVAASDPGLLFADGPVIGKRVDDLFAPELAGRFLDFIRQTLRQKTVNTLVYELEPAAGRVPSSAGARPWTAAWAASRRWCC